MTTLPGTPSALALAALVLAARAVECEDRGEGTLAILLADDAALAMSRARARLLRR